MTNSAQAFPIVEIQCSDRKRIFCLNLEAFCVLQEHMRATTKNPKYKIFKDLNWEEIEGDIELVVLLLWAGLHHDARLNDKDVWTIEKARAVVDMIGASQAQMVFIESFRRAMAPEDFEKTFNPEAAEKKMLLKKRSKKPRKKKKM